MIQINVTGGSLPQKEIDAYLKRGKQKYPNADIIGMDAVVDGDYVELKYHFSKMPRFDRIRRITGYLVGTTDRWNDAKKAEEHDRVKHGVAECCQGK